MEADSPLLRHTINKRLIALLDRAWRTPFTIQSLVAREDADVVAMAASLQLITTRINTKQFGRVWHITVKGQKWLNEAKELK